jgi:hypothetical protein
MDKITADCDYEASDLGWLPGHWPESVAIFGSKCLRTRVVRDNDGDIQWCGYLSEHGEIIRVFND